MNQNQAAAQRPWIITLFCILGILWLIIIFLGIIGIILNIQKNFNYSNLSWLIIEIILFIAGAVALYEFWLMRKKGIYILIIVSATEIIWSIYRGLWPLSLSCGCDFPIILTIIGLIYFKKMS